MLLKFHFFSHTNQTHPTHRNNKSQSLSRPSLRRAKNIPLAERVRQRSPLDIGHFNVLGLAQAISGPLRNRELIELRGAGVPRKRRVLEAAYGFVRGQWGQRYGVGSRVGFLGLDPWVQELDFLGLREAVLLSENPRFGFFHCLGF